MAATRAWYNCPLSGRERPCLDRIALGIYGIISALRILYHIFPLPTASYATKAKDDDCLKVRPSSSSNTVERERISYSRLTFSMLRLLTQSAISPRSALTCKSFKYTF